MAWPELLLVYRSGGVLGGLVKLSDFANKEHSTVSAMTAKGSGVELAWSAYEGAGFFNRYFTGTLTMPAGKPNVAVVPGRIEFSSQSGGGALTKASDVAGLEGTSAGFRAIVAKDLAAALRDGGDCGGSPPGVSVDNYWPHDVANGSVYGCGGALVIWYVTKGVWKAFYYQSVPMCTELKSAGVPSPLPKRIGMQCMTAGGKTVAY